MPRQTPLSRLDARQTVRQEIAAPPFPVLLGALEMQHIVIAMNY
jgi:hypothetical protein